MRRRIILTTLTTIFVVRRLRVAFQKRGSLLPNHKPAILRERVVSFFCRRGVGSWQQTKSLAQLILIGDLATHSRDARMQLVLFDDAVRADVGGELGHARDDKAQEDDSDELKDEQKPAARICLRSKVAEADG